MSQEKYIGMGRPSGHHVRCRDGCSWQAADVMPAGDQGGYDC